MQKLLSGNLHPAHAGWGGLTLNHNFYLKAERLPLLFHKFGVLLDEDTTKPIASNISNIDC